MSNMGHLIILGAGGHAKVVTDIALKNNWSIDGFLDDDKSKKEFLGYPVLGVTDEVFQYQENHTLFLAFGNNQLRKKWSLLLDRADFATLIHPSAVIGPGAAIGKGSAVMANAVINPEAQIGVHCIVNTGAITEHDSIIEDFVHLSPGCKIGGGVTIGAECWLGIGCCIRDHIRICKGCVIGAGAAVVKNILESGTYVGIPAQKKEGNWSRQNENCDTGK